MHKQKELKGMLIVSLITGIIIGSIVLPLNQYIVNHGQNWEGFRIALMCVFPFAELWIWWTLMKKFIWKWKF